jgi:leader peptidase (prepilin peptidase)/N-methyltransferase
MTLSDLGFTPWSFRATAFVWGCLWGSFLNVVIHRVPRGESVVHPPSHCPSCGAAIRGWDNVPLLSWLWLRGQTRCCKTPLSPRYVVVEALGGALGVAVAELVLRTLSPAESAGHVLAVFVADFALALALVGAAFIDAEHMYLPDPITLGGTLFGLATPGLRGLTWTDGLVGAIAGFAVVWLPFVVGYGWLRGRPGMGLGDAKLVMLAGAWFGWPGAFFTLFAGALQASLAVALLYLTGKTIEEPAAVREDREALQAAAAEGDVEAQEALRDDPLATPPGEGFLAARLPFGPFLCLAAIEWMLAGEALAQRFSTAT